MKRGKPFKKGNPGKPKGATNKTTRLVKDIFADVFDDLQNDPRVNLKTWAKRNPTEFYKLSSKLIPMQVDAQVKQFSMPVVKWANENDSAKPDL